MAKLSDSQLCRLAAEKVMGWKAPRTTGGSMGQGCWRDDQGKHMGCVGKWNPLASWADVGEIADLVKMKGFYFELVDIQGKWQCVAEGEDHWSAWREDIAPRAITIAVLLSDGVVTEDQL